MAISDLDRFCLIFFKSNDPLVVSSSLEQFELDREFCLVLLGDVCAVPLMLVDYIVSLVELSTLMYVIDVNIRNYNERNRGVKIGLQAQWLRL